MPEETHSFQAEVARLLDIVANALYSNKEIFLRELVSNASDACDRLRYLAITRPELTKDDPDFAVTIRADAKAKTLAVADNGIGMNREELVGNLGTIAHSGTAAFMDQLGDKKDGAGLIGQFGVGFYSAFMVADKVTVETRRAGDAEGWRWTSDGKGDYSVAPCDEAPERGTRITLQLKKDQREYLEKSRLEHIIKTYSDHIAIPIKLLDGESEDEAPSINAASALWTRAKSEISDEQYKEFYHHVGQSFDEPWLRLHFKAEGKIEYTGLLFVPTTPPYDLFHPDRKNRVKLYVRRVFITDDCPELLPSYLRFLRGVIDSEDMPLNISRELLQHNPMLAKIKSAVVKRVLGELKKKAEKAPDDYATFWKAFGAVLKEGVYEDQDQRETLLKLVRFPSTAGDGLTSLADYVGRMKEGQDAIYFISGEDAEQLARSPQLEGFAAKGVEVLYFTDPVDDFWTTMVPAFEDKPFKSVTKAGTDLDKVKADKDDDEEDEAADDKAEESQVDGVIAFIKLALKDAVKDVRASERLTSSAVCLVADEGDMDMHLERILKQHKQFDGTSSRVLEINPRHGLIQALAQGIEKPGAGEALEDIAFLLLDQARIVEGEPLSDPAAFARRMATVMEKGLGGQA